MKSLTGQTAFRLALGLDTGGVLAFCAVALANPRSRTAVIRAAVGLAGVTLAYPALYLVSRERARPTAAGSDRHEAAALVVAGLVVNTLGGGRLVASAPERNAEAKRSRALSWLLLLGGNTLSVVYLGAIRAAKNTRSRL